MGVWNTFRRFAERRGDTPRRGAKAKRRRDAALSRPRELRVEQFEDRVLLSIGSSAPQEAPLWSYTFQQAIAQAADLGRYQPDALAATHEWVVGLADGASVQQVANSIGADSVQAVPLLGNAFVWQFSANVGSQDVANRLGATQGVSFFYPLVETPREPRFVPNDPIFPLQWNLRNTGQGGGLVGADINVVSAWDTVRGRGVVIGIVDDGLERTHPDLINNYVAAYSYDFANNDPDPMPVLATDNHGTAVAGLAAAQGNNGIGISGTAPSANLAGLRYDMSGNDAEEAAALSHMPQNIAIYNNSWGPAQLLTAPGPAARAAIINGVTSGRNLSGTPLGSIYVWAGGNNRFGRDNVNYDGYANSRYVIAVGALDRRGDFAAYSEPGACLLVSAYADDVWTTDRTGGLGYNPAGDYYNSFGVLADGTSAAAAEVSGVVALMLEARPDLSWRDVQFILAATAKRNDPTDADWTQNRTGYWVNHNYGFGAVDAAAAVARARTWRKLDPEINLRNSESNLALTVPGNVNLNGISRTLTLGNQIGSIERVEVTLDVDHARVGDLEVFLQSPPDSVGNTTISRLAEFHTDPLNTLGYQNWTFTTTRDLGESSGGDWTLIIRNRASTTTGILNSWSLTAYGTAGQALGPELISVIPNVGERIQDGDLLTVAPRELTLRFSEGQRIDPTTLDAIQLVRAGGDGQFGPGGSSPDIVVLAGSVAANDWQQKGWRGLGDKPNEVILRFAEALPDDLYQIQIVGSGLTPLKNFAGKAFHEGKDLTHGFELDLAPQIVAVVPQPVTRDPATGQLQQSRNTIEVYFNSDDLSTLGPTSVYNTSFYTLIAENSPGDPLDDIVVHPTGITYDAAADKAVLTFSDLIENLGNPSYLGVRTFRLRIGNEYHVITTTRTAALGDPGSSFLTSYDVPQQVGNAFTGAAAQALVISSAINPQAYNMEFPGAIDEPGARQVPDHMQDYLLWENHYIYPADSTSGVPTCYYDFPTVYGTLGGNPVYNLITEAQKQRVREIFDLYSHYLGVQFVEKADTGVLVLAVGGTIHVASGDFRAISPPGPPNDPTTDAYSVVNAPGGAGTGFPLGWWGGRVVMNAAKDWAASEFGGAFFTAAMREIAFVLGFGGEGELPPGTLRGPGMGPDPVYPGAQDIVTGQYMYRPDSTDIDLYKFTLTVPGTLSAETIAERLQSTSSLDTLLTLYNGNHEVIARNDDYFSDDSYVNLHLAPGTYYVAVTASGNGDFNPEVENSGLGGTTQGPYDLRLNFEPDPTASLSDADHQPTALDGDGDGTPGGAYNFWFNAQTASRTLFVDKLGPASGNDGSLAKPYRLISDALARAAADYSQTGLGDIVRIVGNNFANDNQGRTVVAVPGSLIVDGRTFTVSDGKQTVTFEFDKDVPPLAAVGNVRVPYTLADTAGTVAASVAIAINGAKISRGLMVSAALNGSTVELSGQTVVFDRQAGPLKTTLEDNVAYEIGRSQSNRVLADGEKMEVPRGVTVMIDAGAVFKLRGANIDVGSSAQQINRSHGALQVLGTPVSSVYFTSYQDQLIGNDTEPLSTTGAKGDWGGLVFRNNLDYDEMARDPNRRVLETAGIFLNYVNHADLRYGGGRVTVNGVSSVYTPIHMAEARPTVSFNTISRSADAALSADPNSFLESKFQANSDTASALKWFTADYGRVGPDVHGNYLADNSVNGMFVRIRTAAGVPLDTLDIPGRFDDLDIVHVIPENLIVSASPGGPVQVPGTCALSATGTLIQTVPAMGGGSPPVQQIDDGDYFSISDGFTTVVFEFDNNGLVTPNRVPVTFQINHNADQIAADVTTAIQNAAATYGLGVGAIHAGAAVDLVGSVIHLAGFKLGVGGGVTPQGRTHARLDIDPGIITKLKGSRIETQTGAQLIAEGTKSYPVIFSSIQDDRYGAGGTFDTSNDKDRTLPNPGDWAGLEFGPLSQASIDWARVFYAGGNAPIEGGFAGFDPVEIRQAVARITNSLFENNAAVASRTPDRNGRGFVDPATIFIRGAQPVIVGNTFRNNRGAVANIDVNAMNSTVVRDWGRSTGLVAAFPQYDDNHGPLVRENRFAGNGVNGMVVRGGTLTTEVVWDDTDIAHVLYDEIVVPNFHTFGGLRLQSTADESLVVKLRGPNAGFTASGRPLEIDDRIGGMVQVVGTAAHPVIMTSLSDDTVAAGFDPQDQPQFDTNNDGPSQGAPGDWRSVKIDRYSNDRNVAVVDELEQPFGLTGDANGIPAKAQLIGNLATTLQGGDDVLRLGFEVHGFIRSDAPADQDVYGFNAAAGQEVWIDIDRTAFAMDAVVDLIDADGNVLAWTDNSLTEPAAASTTIDGQGLARPMPASSWTVKDYYSQNPLDAGMRVVLPGAAGEVRTYYVRVRAAVRTLQAVPGSAIQDGDVFTLTDGIASLNGTYTYHSVTFEFDSGGGVSGNNIPVPFTTNSTANQMAQAIRNAIVNTARVAPYNLRLTASVVDNTVVLQESPAVAGGLIGFDPGTSGLAQLNPTGAYQLQVRLQELQEIPGSIVSHAWISYAANGIEVYGQPTHSPLLGESAEAETIDPSNPINILNPNNTVSRNPNTITAISQPIGNLLASDREALAVAGNFTAYGGDLTGYTDVDYYRFGLDMQATGATNTRWPLEFDVDYADGMGRPDTNLYVFDSTGKLLYIGQNSNVADDIPAPNHGTDSTDLSRGSFGVKDPSIGPVYLREGAGVVYDVAITTQGPIPYALRNQPLLRLEPVDSIQRITEDHIGSQNGSQLAANAQYEMFSGTSSIQLNSYADDFHLGDVTLYVNAPKRLYTVDPFTGQRETDVSNPWNSTTNLVWPNNTSAYSYNDLAMRNDGHLVSIQSYRTNPATFAEFNTGNATTVNASQTLGITAGEEDPNSRAVVNGVVYYPTARNVPNGSLNVQALTYDPFNGGRTYILAVANMDFQPFEGNPASSTLPYKNLLYVLNADGTPVQGYDPNGTLASPGTRNISSIIPFGDLSHDNQNNPVGQITGLTAIGNSIYAVTKEHYDPATRQFISGGVLYQLNGVDLSISPQRLWNWAFYAQDNATLLPPNQTTKLAKTIIPTGRGPTLTRIATVAYPPPSGNPAVSAAGQVINYTYTVSNDGTNSLRVVLTDDNGTLLVPGDDFNPMRIAGDTNRNGRLDPTETWTYIASHTVTQAEINAGNPLVNTATVTTAAVSGAAVTIQLPAGINVLKSADKQSVTSPNEAITYTYTVTNTGTAELTQVVVTDDNGTPGVPGDDFNPTFVAGGDTDGDGKLDPAEIWVYNATRRVTQAEIDAGTPLVNRVTATSKESGPVTSSAAVTIQNAAGINVLKSADVASVKAKDDVITYTYPVTNAGNAPLTGVVVTDDNYTPGVPGDDFPVLNPAGDANNNGALDPTETWTYTATYTVTQPEIDAGTPLVNTATATGNLAVCSAAMTIEHIAGINVQKSANVAGVKAAGDVITYTYTVTNAGTTPITGVVLTDPKDSPTFVSGDANGNGALDPTETWTYTAAHIVTQAEINAGTPVVDTATVTSTQGGTAVSSATVTIQHPGGINVQKSAHVANPIAFSGLNIGPQTVENAKFANVLFATDAGDLTNPTDPYGHIYAFAPPTNVDPTQNVPLRPIFLDGQTRISTIGVTSPQGLAFSPIDYNLWHVTNERGSDWHRGGDPLDRGHGIEDTDSFETSRPHDAPYPVPGGTSFYFGLEDPRKGETISFQPGAGNFIPSSSAVFQTYDLPGGAYGSLTTNTFSLKGYGPNDLPTLYFNYFADTAAGPWDQMRVFISTGYAGASEWNQVSAINGAVSDGWRQARISLSGYAGYPNLRLRFDFSTAGDMQVGTTSFGTATGSNLWTGTILHAVPGNELYDGNYFPVNNPTWVGHPGGPAVRFEFDMGYALTMPNVAGRAIQDGEWVRIATNDSPVPVTFEFDNNGVWSPSNQRVAISPDDSAAAVAQKLVTEINTALGALAVIDQAHPERIFLNSAARWATSVTQSAAPAVVREGDAPGSYTLGAEPIVVRGDMTAGEVATAIAEAMDRRFSGWNGVGTAPETAAKVDPQAAVVHLIGHAITTTLPGIRLVPQAGLAPLSYSTVLPGDLTPAANNLDGFTDFRRGQDNRHEGVYIDDIIIGFAEHGEMVTAANPDTTFWFPDIPPGGVVLAGPYQMEIRRGQDYGVWGEGVLGHRLSNLGYDTLVRLARSFDTNDRFTSTYTLEIPPAAQIPQGASFVIGDGINKEKFRLLDPTKPLPSQIDGIPIYFSGRYSNAQVASLVVSAINRVTTIDVTASSITAQMLSVGGSSRVDLFGAKYLEFDNLWASNAPSAYGFGDTLVAGAGIQYVPMARGDANRKRDQGQIILDANRITNSSAYGIVVDAAARDQSPPMTGVNWPHPAPVLPLIENNTQRLVPGMTILNNVIAFNRTGGIHFSGDPNATAGQPVASVPFGRIVNNTIYGLADPTAARGTGILVDQNASPTLLNNIVASLDTGIRVDATSASTVLGTTVYQNNGTNVIGIGLGTFPLQAAMTDPLFVDAAGGNFYPDFKSVAIDSALDSLADRPAMVTVRRPLGIPDSPILAPDRDLYGQLRIDDPNVSPPSGMGGNIFKDRGAIDRVDNLGPTAALIDPLDNDPANLDRNRNPNDVLLVGALLTEFSIQLSDTDGVGIADSTVTPGAVEIHKDGDPTPLNLDFDYLFSYDPINDVISLYPAAGIWAQSSTYAIELSPLIRDLADNPVQPNRPDGTTVFTVTLSALDYGDAPDPTFPTLLARDGARHIIFPDTPGIPGFYLGTGVTGEPDANQNALANGDKGDDGVVTDPLLIGTTVPVRITVSGTGTAIGKIDAWMDFNGDGDWNDVGEQVFTSQPVNGGVNNLSIVVPATVQPGHTLARFRLSKDGGLSFTGEAPDGEVEDYRWRLVRYLEDFSDAPEPPYPTLFNDADPQLGGASHQTDPTKAHLGATVGSEPDGQPSPLADADSYDDGVLFDPMSPLVPGQVSHVTVKASGPGSSLSAWIDFNGQNAWEPGEKLAFYTSYDAATDTLSNLLTGPLAAGNNELYFRVPLVGTVLGYTFSRFRLCSDPADIALPTGPARDGEVEDYRVLIIDIPLDYGDAPDPPYATLKSSHGARHRVDFVHYLGATVDYEPDGQPNPTATGDPDDDGVRFVKDLSVPGDLPVENRLVPDHTAEIVVTASASGVLNAWIDFNADGDWTDVYAGPAGDPAKNQGDQIAFYTDDTLTTTTVNPHLVAGENHLKFYVPKTLNAAKTFARFRFSDQENLSFQGPDAEPYPVGEVEDYQVEILVGSAKISGNKFNDLNANRQWDRNATSVLPTIQLVPPGQYVPMSFPFLAPDDGYSAALNLGFSFQFYGNTYQQFYINANGTVTFGGPLAPLTPIDYQQNPLPMIAPFWSDVDTRLGGEVRLATGTSLRGNPFVQVDWVNVGYFNLHYDKTNSFTLYIEDDPGGDMVAFVYNKLQWTTGDRDPGHQTGFLGQGAQIGFDAGPQGSVDLGRPKNQTDLAALLVTKQYGFRFDPSTGWPSGIEPGVAGVTVYLDLNNNAVWDSGEPSTVTATDNLATPGVDETGYYEFAKLLPGAYVVREVIPDHWSDPLEPDWGQTYPYTGVDSRLGHAGIRAVAGAQLADGQMFSLGDGTITLTFEFNNVGGVAPTHVPVPFSITDSANAVATAIAAAINGAGPTSGLAISAIANLNVVSLTGPKVTFRIPAHTLPLLPPPLVHLGEVTLKASDVVTGVNFGNYRVAHVGVSDVSVVEGNSGQTQVNVTLHFTESFGAPVTFFYATANGTATTADSDYRAASGPFQLVPQSQPLPKWDLKQVTHDLANDYNYSVWGDKVVYQGTSGVDTEIYLYDDATGVTRQISEGSLGNCFATIYGSNVVWAGKVNDGSDFEILRYDINTGLITRLTNNDYDEKNPQLSDRFVTWWAATASGQNSIFVYDLQNGGAPVKISDDTFNNADPQVSGASVVWSGTQVGVPSARSEIFFWDGTFLPDGTPTPPRRLTNGAQDNVKPRIDGSNVVWQAAGVTNHQIFLWDGTFQLSGLPTPPVQISSYLLDNLDPQISGNNVVWQALGQTFGGAQTSSILWYDLSAGGPAVDVSGTVYHHEGPKVFGNRMAWSTYDGADWEVSYYEIGKGRMPLNITNNDYFDGGPLVSDALVIWRSFRSGTSEVVRAVPLPPELTQTITLIVNGDTRLEPDEYFFLDLSTPDLAVLDVPRATITILNDDGTLDYGDAPAPYPTLLANNGARHSISAGLYLGSRVDSEANGQPTLQANGDDASGTDDEDGVTFDTPFMADQYAQITVTASISGYLDAWIDFNGDGSWDRWLDRWGVPQADHVPFYTDDTLTTTTVTPALLPGPNTLVFRVPRDAHPGTSYARFRFRATDAPISYTGMVLGGEVEDYVVQVQSNVQQVGQTVVAIGSGDDDVYKFWAGPKYVVSLNGIVYKYNPANVNSFTFNGMGGYDQVYFYGDPGNETAQLYPDHAGFGSTHYNVSVSDVDVITAAGGGGSDAATVNPGTGSDTFIATPTFAVLIGPGVSLRANNFPSVVANASPGGQDVAYLFDSAGDDTFEAYPSYAVLRGTGFSNRANDFGFVTARSTQGGTDAAVFLDSTGNDNFVAYPAYATMTGRYRPAGAPADRSYYNRAEGFGSYVGTSSAGGADLARLYDSAAGDEQFTATPTQGTLVGAGVFSRATGFRYLSAYATGGTDTARLDDSAGTDTFVATPGYAVIYASASAGNPAYLNRVTGFDAVDAYSTHGGDDSARLYDSAGDDVFTATPIYAKLQNDPTTNNTNYVVNAHTFRYAHAYATSGGFDKATLTDSSGTDTLEARPTYSVLSGTTAGQAFYNRANYFDQVVAVSGGLGGDFARLYDSAGSEVLQASPTSATLAGPGFSYQAQNFRYVTAYATTGGDEAFLTDSTGADIFTGTPTTARLTTATVSYYVEARQFAKVTLTSVGGDDTANLSDSAGNDTFWGRLADAVLSDGSLDLTNGDLLAPNTYYLKLLGFTSSLDKVNVSGAAGGANTRKIVTPVDYALAFTGTWTGDPWP